MARDQLHDDDAEFLDNLWSQTDPNATITHRVDRLNELVKEANRNGSPHRAKVDRIRWWGWTYGARQRYYDVEHGEKVAYVIGDRVGVVPKRYAHKPVNPLTGETNGYLQAVMAELTWEGFFTDLRRVKARWEALGNNIEVWDQVAALYDEFPESKTPGEACLLGGIDPDVLLDFRAG